MEIFWNTIADYNTATWPVQIAFLVVGAFLLFRLYVRPSELVCRSMSAYMAAVNLWIAVAYYLIFCAPREYNGLSAIFWAIMGLMWIYDAAGGGLLQYRRRHSRFAFVLLAMPVLYPLLSLALGRKFPVMTSSLMPCSVAVFTIGLMMEFSRKANIVLALLMCHWALAGLLKVRFFDIPEDYLLACSVIPALYLFFSDYTKGLKAGDCKPSVGVLRLLFVILCVAAGAVVVLTFMDRCDLLAAVV